MWGHLTRKCLPLVLTGLWILVRAPMLHGGQDAVILDNDTRHLQVNHYLTYLVEDAPLTYLQVSNPQYRSRWKPLDSQTVNLGIAPKPAWFRLDLLNNANAEVSWIMEIGWALLDRVEVFQYNQHRNSWSPGQTGGNLLPIADRPLEHRNFLFPLNLPRKELTTVYIRVETAGQFLLTVDLMRKDTFWASNQHHSIVLGAFFGILLAMLLYNASLCYFTRDISYFYYTFYVLSIILFTLAHTGIGNQYIWDGSDWIKRKGYATFAILSFLASVLFIRQFLSLKQYGGWVLQLNNVFLVYWSFALLSNLFWVNALMVKTTEPMVLLGCFAALITGIYLWIKGNRSARYFTIAWSFLLFGTFIYSASAYGLIARTPLTQYTQMVGFVIEVILLSYALAERINRERADRENAQRIALELSDSVSSERAQKLEIQEQLLDLQRQANEKLEQRVAERTDALEHAMREKEEHLAQLQLSLKEIKTLRGVIPICSYCKNIRNDKGAWDKLEKYIGDHSDAEFSHGICPECYRKVVDRELG